MSNSMTSPERDQALAAMENHRTTVARWAAEKATAEAELSDLQQRAGDEVLDDESAAQRLPRQMQALRDRIDIATRALAVAENRLHEASVAVLLAEAAQWDAEAAHRQAVLDDHDARRDGLLAKLQEFTGEYYTAARSSESSSVVHVVVGAPEGPNLTSTRAPLAEAVTTAERTAFVLREVAAGRDPHPALMSELPVIGPRPDPASFYPASVWGPEAILPAPLYQARLANGTVDVREPAPLSPSEAVDAVWRTGGATTMSGKPI